MPVIIDLQEHGKVRKFLGQRTLLQLQRLERINPWCTWVLRHFYGTVRTSIRQLCELTGENQVFINRKRQEGLFLLGWKGIISAKAQQSARYFNQDLCIRSRLAHLQQTVPLLRGDRELLACALSIGPSALEISRVTDWSEAEARWGLKRLLAWSDRRVLQPGEHVRRLSFQELRESGVNKKAELEQRILEELSTGISLVDLAKEWQVPQTTISALTAEIRVEVSRHSSTRRDYRRLLRRGQEEGLRATQLVKWINSNILPLYQVFRSAASPFSLRERRYLRQRIQGVGVTAAARAVLAIGYSPASVIDRAFLEPLKKLAYEVPEHLPLPPFTRAQEELMERLRYARIV